MAKPGSNGSVISPIVGAFTSATTLPWQAVPSMRPKLSLVFGSETTSTNASRTIIALPEGGAAISTQVPFVSPAKKLRYALGAASSVLTVLVTLADPEIWSWPAEFTWATLAGVVGSAMLTTVAPAANAVPPKAMNTAIAPRIVPVPGREKCMMPSFKGATGTRHQPARWYVVQP